jgi:ribonuclease BN (tRNA processing enzyme)
VRVTLWGTRGSLAAPGAETMHYGGNTSCVEVMGDDGTLLVLDAGTGIRPLGESIQRDIGRIDLLLTHLHMDHIQGLGFFDPLFWPGLEVHLWGPPSTTQDLRERLSRYLSPPLFPVRLRDLPCDLTLHDVVATGDFSLGGFEIESQLVCHPGPTVGYRIAADDATLCYMPDHEPALGAKIFPGEPNWLSGFELAKNADLLIHDAQFTHEEYPSHVGWGHSSITHVLDFARAAGARHLVPFHHDPSHSDAILEQIYSDVLEQGDLPFELSPGVEGESFDLGSSARKRSSGHGAGS